MHFHKEGTTGHPVVLIHGLGAHSFSWEKTVKELSPTFTTYAVDLLGFGESHNLAPSAYTVEAQAEAVAEWIEAQKLSTPHIIGHSMGGAVCCSLALTAKAGELGKMVLIAAVAPELSLQMKEVLAALAGDPGTPATDLTEAEAEDKARGLLTRAYAKSSSVKDDQVKGYAKGLLKKAQNHALKEHARTLGSVKFTEPDLKAIKAKVTSHIIWGEDDPWLPVKQGKTLAESLGADIKRIPKCGHIPQEEQPEETNKAIKTFLLAP